LGDDTRSKGTQTKQAMKACQYRKRHDEKRKNSREKQKAKAREQKDTRKKKKRKAHDE
jgi:hypothetical protein